MATSRIPLHLWLWLLVSTPPPAMIFTSSSFTPLGICLAPLIAEKPFFAWDTESLLTTVTFSLLTTSEASVLLAKANPSTGAFLLPCHTSPPRHCLSCSSPFLSCIMVFLPPHWLLLSLCLLVPTFPSKFLTLGCTRPGPQTFASLTIIVWVILSSLMVLHAFLSPPLLPLPLLLHLLHHHHHLTLIYLSLYSQDLPWGVLSFCVENRLLEVWSQAEGGVSYDTTAVIIAAEWVRSGRVMNSFQKVETREWTGYAQLGEQCQGRHQCFCPEQLQRCCCH